MKLVCFQTYAHLTLFLLEAVAEFPPLGAVQVGTQSKLVGDVVVLLKDRSLEKARKKVVKAKSKTRKKKKANK